VIRPLKPIRLEKMMSFLKGNIEYAEDEDAVLVNFAAELTAAIYPIALEHGVGDRWIDLELDLWRVITEIVVKWDRSSRHISSPREWGAWREVMLEELVEAACRTAVRHNNLHSFTELQFSLHRSFHAAIEKKVRSFRRSPVELVRTISERE
jgi:hypothetical protein